MWALGAAAINFHSKKTFFECAVLLFKEDRNDTISVRRGTHLLIRFLSDLFLLTFSSFNLHFPRPEIDGWIYLNEDRD